MRGLKEHVRRVLGVSLMVSMGVTEAVLLLEGRWQEAIPLHLCSLSALASAALAFCPCQMALGFLWYLGMPGALLALVFPAPAASRFQLLLNASYVTTHLLIIVIPLLRLLEGMRPRRGRALHTMLALQGAALCACCVNAALGTDFLFLSSPPAGTPLETVYRAGYAPYLISLEALCMLVCMGMERLLGLLGRREAEGK